MRKRATDCVVTVFWFVWTITGVINLAVWGGLIYVLVHFAGKYW